MKYNICWIAILITVLCLSACKKEKIQAIPVASLKLVNVVVGGGTVFMNSDRTAVYNNESFDLALRTDRSELYIWPEGDSLHPYYRSAKPTDIADGDIFTMFLGGEQAAPEGILVKESLPLHTDSVAGIRFIHLSAGTSPVNVTLGESPDVKEFSNVGYKGITQFKNIPAGMANASYTFQVRDAASDSILAEIPMSGVALKSFVPRFRNITLVFQGQAGGPLGLGITRVNHY